MSLLIPAFSLIGAPALLTVYLRCTRNAPLPITLLQSLDFGDVLEPRYIFGAGALDQ